MSQRAGRIPLVLLAFLAFYHAGRPLLPGEESPTFFVHRPPPIQVGLVGDWSQPGIHHFFDDSPTSCVNVMTSAECSRFWAQMKPLVSGRAYRLGAYEAGVSMEWLPSSQRIALQIPLHPDRMSPSDWEYLPGIGPRLAENIEAYRQINGEFGTLERLRRVKGIGEKKISSWRRYFLVF